MNARDIAHTIEDEFDEQFRPPVNNLYAKCKTLNPMRCLACNVWWDGDEPCWICGEHRTPKGPISIDKGIVLIGQWGFPADLVPADTLFD